LPYRYYICDNCPRVFRERSKFNSWLFVVYTYFLYRLTTLRVEVKYLPKNTGVYVLTINSSGVHGVITLQYLKALEERISLLYLV
jgi:hypothetical protein